MWPAADQRKTQRGRFLGVGRNVAHPYFAERASPTASRTTNGQWPRCVASWKCRPAASKAWLSS